MDDTGTRAYRSAVRDEQARATRERILRAATDLFADRGWSGTGMRDVAVSAGVSVETVYKTFTSKTELLHRVIDVIVVGDDEPVPLAEREVYAAMASGSPSDRARAGAALVTAINARHAPVLPAMREAASGDEATAALVVELHERRRLEFRRAGSMIADRPLTDTEVDGLWAVLSADAYLLLTRHAGWTDEAYQDWASDSLVALLDLPGRSRPARPSSS